MRKNPSDFDWNTTDPKRIRETRLDEVTVIYTYDGKIVHLISIRTKVKSQGKGKARAVLLKLCKEADDRGASIVLEASPLTKSVSLSRLVSFYESLGFIPTGRTINPLGDPELIRYPEDLDVKKNRPRSELHPGSPLDNPAFRRWFGDSVVVDEDGEPVVVYHGGFDVVGSEAGAFRPGRALGKWGLGIYFTPLEYRARWYAEDNEGVVGAYYLRMGRPLVVLESQAYDPNVEGIIRQARQIGAHDGVIVLDGTNTRNVRFDRNVTEIIVFDPKQVKAAFDNDGSFDPENPDVKKNPPGRTFIPPQKVADEAVYGLYLRSQMPPSSRCCTPVGLARAKQLKNREPVSVETLKRMRSYFQRHEVDKKGSRWAIDSKGFQAWLLWGGDSGRAFAEKALREVGEANLNARTRYRQNKPMTGDELQNELLDSLNDPVNAYDFWDYLAEYAEEIGFDSDDPYDIVDDEAKADDFMVWVEDNNILERMLNEQGNIPPKFFFSHATALPKGTWLVHHSPSNLSEFDRGATYEWLGLSTQKKVKVKVGSKNTDDEIAIGERVYVFGFQPHNDPAISRFGLPLSSQYGDEWHLLRTDAAVEAYHSGDEQTQVIFPAGSEYDLVQVNIDGDFPWTANIGDHQVEAEKFDELLEKVEQALGSDV